MLTLLRDLRRLRKTIGLPQTSRGRSLAIRHVDAGSCNGCEHELTQLASPYYDLQRFGLGIVASPRHADVLLVTGPVTSRMHEPLLVAYNAMPSRAESPPSATAHSAATSSAPWRTSSAPSTRFYVSTSASRVAHRHRTPSQRRCFA